ncbi:hypothetical protein CPC16_006465 [Podila verticillata]|nr:hypothetical protein CPC16_006465 [Podila verticillata]
MARFMDKERAPTKQMTEMQAEWALKRAEGDAKRKRERDEDDEERMKRAKFYQEMIELILSIARKEQ